MTKRPRHAAIGGNLTARRNRWGWTRHHVARLAQQQSEPEHMAAPTVQHFRNAEGRLEGAA